MWASAQILRANDDDVYDAADIAARLMSTKQDVENRIWRENAPADYNTLWTQLSPFDTIRTTLVNTCNNINISNSWLKGYELINRYAPALSSKSLHVFDNCSFPGAFALSAHHYAKTRCTNISTHITACSYYNTNAITQDIGDIFGDRYLLFGNARLNTEHGLSWVQPTETFNGDMTSISQIDELCDLVDKPVDLYLSDGGVLYDGKYEFQEQMQFPLNCGQILAGLKLTRQGGTVVCKQYTYFNQATQQMMLEFAKCFESAHIAKPMSSRYTNSETYLVGVGFKQMTDNMLKILTDGITTPVPTTPPDTGKLLPKDMFKCFETQITSMRLTADVVQAAYARRMHNDRSPRTNSLLESYTQRSKQQMEEWYAQNPIMPIEETARLTMNDSMKQNGFIAPKARK